MPSIFIWKSTSPTTSNKFIKYYTGSNWFLEDNEYSSKSYIYLEQMVITGFDDSVITFHVKQMPQDWVGSELLEVTNIPYQMIKSDEYGTLDRIGTWMRFTSKYDICFTKENLENEISKIKKWMNNVSSFKNTSIKHKESKYNSNYNYTKYKESNTHASNIHLDTNKIQSDFQKFMSQYNLNLTINPY
jgi:hypothetical protein